MNCKNKSANTCPSTDAHWGLGRVQKNIIKKPVIGKPRNEKRVRGPGVHDVQNGEGPQGADDGLGVEGLRGGDQAPRGRF